MAMYFEKFRKQVHIEVFDYPLIADYLKDFQKPRDKIAALVKEEKIIRLKNGLYVFGNDWRNSPLSLEMTANLIYGPSCISFEYALTYYGMLAERATTITSLAIGDSKKFDTPFGLFEYRATDPQKFKIGIDYIDLGNEGGFFIASREKALADLVYRTAGIRSKEQLSYYLFEEMRIDENIFRSLDFEKLLNISKIYKKSTLLLLSKI